MTIICKICHEDDVEENLISPCNCNGSIKYIHKTCLIKWIKMKSHPKLICNECKIEYSLISKLEKFNIIVKTIFSIFFIYVISNYIFSYFYPNCYEYNNLSTSYKFYYNFFTTFLHLIVSFICIFYIFIIITIIIYSIYNPPFFSKSILTPPFFSILNYYPLITSKIEFDFIFVFLLSNFFIFSIIYFTYKYKIQFIMNKYF